MKTVLMDMLLGFQVYVTVFVALHDWAPFGRLNTVKAVRRAQSTARLLTTTILSTLPFAFGLGASLFYRPALPNWLWIYLTTVYTVATYGLLRTWWAPYLICNEPERAARYLIMHGNTHSFLPMHNGMRPNTLHVTVHVAVIASLLDLAVLGLHGRLHGRLPGRLPGR